jgi:hypothetical protein
MSQLPLLTLQATTNAVQQMPKWRKRSQRVETINNFNNTQKRGQEKL